MKIRYYFVGFVFFLCFANTGNTYYSTHSTYLANQIKPNPITRSKPTSSHIKLASVQFLGKNDKTLNYSCREDGGWVETENGCEPAACSDYPYHGGSPELEMCTSTSTCLSGGTWKYKCDDCRSEYNLTLKNGRCFCDTSIYPHNSLNNPCPDNNTEINKTDMCQEINSSRTLVEYYKGCKCPSGWDTCTSNQFLVGIGDACTASDDGKSYYVACECDANHQTTCGDFYHTPIGLPCHYRGVTKYEGCEYCSIAEGKIHSSLKDQYWCDESTGQYVNWVEWENVSEFFRD